MSLWAALSDAMLTQCVNMFGVSVRYQRPFADEFAVNGIVGHPNAEQPDVYSAAITLDVRLADFIGTPADPEPALADLVTVNGKQYTVYQISADSEGAAKLFLQA